MNEETEITLEFEVENIGDPAHMTTFNVEYPKTVNFVGIVEVSDKTIYLILILSFSFSSFSIFGFHSLVLK